MQFFFFKPSKSVKMKDSLFAYMLILTLLIIVVIGIGMLFLGTFTKPADMLSNTLNLQVEVFEKEIRVHQEELAMRGSKLSYVTSSVIDEYLKYNKLRFSDIENSPTHIKNLQNEIIGILKEEIEKAESSGIFVLLNTTVNSNAEEAEFSRAGVYLQRGSISISDNSLILYRGDSAIGKENGIMPHRKWKFEFDTRVFPGYDEIMSTAPSIPLEKTYRFTDVAIIPGTSERASLLTMPIRGYNNEIWGICGFETSSSSFKENHRQSSIMQHLTCLWTLADENIINHDNVLLCGTENAFYPIDDSDLTIKKFKDDLYRFDSSNMSFVGVIKLMEENSSNDHMVAVMIPKDDYDSSVASNTLQIVVFLLLLSFFAFTLCRVLSKHFISPVIKSIESLRRLEKDTSNSSISEIDDLFVYLANKDKEQKLAYDSLIEEKGRVENELEKVQSEIEKLAYSRKSEIDPDDYKHFVMGIKTLTKSERTIFDLYLEGKDAKEIASIVDIKDSTLKFHNSNIYQKLGVTSRKQMMKFAALYSTENGK